MIELRNLTKSYGSDGGRHYVFRDLNFTFPDGVNIALIGRNGAGKSTLMRLLGGIDSPDSGQVVTDKTISWPVGLKGGFQGVLTGRDNCKFVCRIFGASDAELKKKLAFVQAFAELGDYFDQPVKSYSAGMRSRLAFGLSMAFDFDYYLIDEVMAVGDAQFKRKSKAVLHDRLKTSSLILVTHNMSEVAKLCDVVVLVEGGRAILYTDVREGIDAYQGEGMPSTPDDAAARREARRARRLEALGPNGKRPAGAGGPGKGAGKGPRAQRQAGPGQGPRRQGRRDQAEPGDAPPRALARPTAPAADPPTGHPGQIVTAPPEPPSPEPPAA